MSNIANTGNIGPPMIVIDPIGPIIVLLLGSVLGLLVFMLSRQFKFMNRYAMYRLAKNTTLEFSQEGREWFALLNSLNVNDSVAPKPSAIPADSLVSYFGQFIKWVTGQSAIMLLVSSYFSGLIQDKNKDKEEEIKGNARIEDKKDKEPGETPTKKAIKPEEPHNVSYKLTAVPH